MTTILAITDPVLHSTLLPLLTRCQAVLLLPEQVEGGDFAVEDHQEEEEEEEQILTYQIVMMMMTDGPLLVMVLYCCFFKFLRQLTVDIIGSASLLLHFLYFFVFVLNEFVLIIFNRRPVQTNHD